MEVGCPRRSSEHLLCGPGHEGLCRQRCRAWGRHPEECHPGRLCRAECAPRWGGGVLLPGAHPRSRASPDTVSIGPHSGPVTSGCYPASEVGVRGGGMFCSPCTASNRNQVMPGVIGSPLRQSPGGRSESTAQAERPESRVLGAAAQEPASERSPGGSVHSAEEF